jgi:hypothetical protein
MLRKSLESVDYQSASGGGSLLQLRELSGRKALRSSSIDLSDPSSDTSINGRFKIAPLVIVKKSS